MAEKKNLHDSSTRMSKLSWSDAKRRATQGKAFRQVMMPRTAQARKEGRDPTDTETVLDVLSVPFKPFLMPVRTGLSYIAGENVDQNQKELRKWKIILDEAATNKRIAEEKGDDAGVKRYQDQIRLAAEEVRKYGNAVATKNLYSPAGHLGKGAAQFLLDAIDEVKDDPAQLAYLATGYGSALAKDALGWGLKDVLKRGSVNAAEAFLNTAADQGGRLLEEDPNYRPLDDWRSMGLEFLAQFVLSGLGDVADLAKMGIGKKVAAARGETRQPVGWTKYRQAQKEWEAARKKLLPEKDIPEGVSETSYYRARASDQIPTRTVDEFGNPVEVTFAESGKLPKVAENLTMDVPAQTVANLNKKAQGLQSDFIKKRDIELDYQRVMKGVDPVTEEGKAFKEAMGKLYQEELEKATKRPPVYNDFGEVIPPETIAEGRMRARMRKEWGARNEEALSAFRQIYDPETLMPELYRSEIARGEVFPTKESRFGDKVSREFDEAREAVYFSDEPIAEAIRMADKAKRMAYDRGLPNASNIYADVSRGRGEYIRSMTNDDFLRRARLSDANAEVLGKARKTVEDFFAGKIKTFDTEVQHAMQTLAEADPQFRPMYEDARRAYMAEQFSKGKVIPEESLLESGSGFFGQRDVMPEGFNVATAPQSQVNELAFRGALVESPLSPIEHWADGGRVGRNVPTDANPAYAGWSDAVRKFNALQGIRPGTTPVGTVVGQVPHQLGMAAARDAGRYDRERRIDESGLLEGLQNPVAQDKTATPQLSLDEEYELRHGKNAKAPKKNEDDLDAEFEKRHPGLAK